MKKNILFQLAFIGALAVTGTVTAQSTDAGSGVNLSVMAVPSTGGGGRGGGGNRETLNAIINGVDPRSSSDRQHGMYLAGGPRGGGGRRGTPSPSGPLTNTVQLEWSQPVSTKQIDVYWFVGNTGGGGRGGGGRAAAPTAYRIKYWTGEEFVPVENASGLGVEEGKYNTTTFNEVTTSRLRLEFDSESNAAAGLLQWKVYDSGRTPNFAPIVTVGEDRSVVTDGKTYLSGTAKDEGKPGPMKLAWSKDSGPGTVTFANASIPATTATFSAAGDYVLKLVADDGDKQTEKELKVTVDTPPPADRLDVVYTKNFSVDSPLWNERVKALMVNWIPHCIDQINSTNLRVGPGGIDNFVEAAKALKGEPHAAHKGYVFANAWVHQTVEAMSIALQIDPKGDKDIIKAQAKMKATLDDWIPKILAAQEPDGYLQTAWTLRDTNRWRERWSEQSRGNHEGYTAGYFLESAINHYTLTQGKDKRLYNAAKKLADCWYNNLGPAPKKPWYDGHEEMEQALVRFGRFVNDMEGQGKGDHYIELAKFLLDNRFVSSRPGEASEYDQSHLPVQKQYEAVGHAVRAVYLYSGMADVAAETHDPDYQSAVASLWDDLVNKKYYLTGGVGSGETSEGFGADYSLGNQGAYCEACASCGEVFFQYKMNIAYHDAKYADLYEDTIYNALLGSTDLAGKNFYYRNHLDETRARAPWDACPCCVGNIPRTLLMLPTWMYVKGANSLYVNLYIGSTVNVEKVAGTDVQMVQKTDYPWKGDVAITVNPAKSKQFAVMVRVPDRSVSTLYKTAPEVSGTSAIKVNGKVVAAKIDKGYAMIDRTWKKGDKIEFVLPMAVQRVTADTHIAADRGRIALRYGPLIYNFEAVDQADKTLSNRALGANSALTTEWDPNMLDGIVAIKGTWADGTPLIAVPNYARLNRGGQSIVWAKEDNGSPN